MSHAANEYALAIDIGGTKVAVGIVNRQGSVIQRQVRPTRADLGAAAVLQVVIEAGQEMLATARRFDLTVVGVGVGSAGQVNTDDGSISYASANLPGWSGLPLANELRSALHLPVAVDNDVNALALGEQHFGAGRGYREALYVAVGTGVGGALVRANKLWHGATWSAGEICHLVIAIDGTRLCSCGATGHLEAYTCGPAIVQRFRDFSGRRDIHDLHAVAELARSGDGPAQQAIAEGAKTLGIALGGLANVLDPQVIIIGGGVAEIGPLWWRHCEDGLRANPMPGPARVALLPAQLGGDAVLIGAAYLVFEAS